MTDDPDFYHTSKSYPPMPMCVTGFMFDPATGTFDFSAVPGFDLGRLQYLQHVKTGAFLHGRPYRRQLDLAAVDGVPVPERPTVGTGISPSDEILAVYDLPVST